MVRKKTKKSTESIALQHVEPEEPQICQQHDGLLLPTLTQFLDESEFRYDPLTEWVDEYDALRFRIESKVTLECGTFRIQIYGNEQLRSLVFYVVSPMAIPRKRRPLVAEFITRTNYDLIYGNYEMDYMDGEVRHKMSMEFDGTPLNYSLLRYLLHMGLFHVQDFQPALEAVVMGELTPEEADQDMRNKENRIG
jgi:hypothetical protein